MHFVDIKMLPPETASRLFKHVEFQVFLLALGEPELHFQLLAHEADSRL